MVGKAILFSEEYFILVLCLKVLKSGTLEGQIAFEAYRVQIKG